MRILQAYSKLRPTSFSSRLVTSIAAITIAKRCVTEADSKIKWSHSNSKKINKRKVNYRNNIKEQLKNINIDGRVVTRLHFGAWSMGPGIISRQEGFSLKSGLTRSVNGIVDMI